MNRDRSELQAWTSRLESLERRQRRTQRAMALAALCVSAALLMGQAPGIITPAGMPPPSIEDRVVAREFSLVDREGTLLGSLVADDTGSASLVLFDTDSRPRAILSVRENFGPALTLYDGNGQARTVLGATTLVASHVTDEAGVTERRPASSLVLFDGEGQLLFRTP